MHVLTRRVALAILAVAVSAPLSISLAADPAPPPVISRDILFGNPERASPKISPDGKRFAWIAPDDKNVLQVWVKTVGKEDGKKVTADKKRGIRQYLWAEDDKHLLYMQDADGDENFHVFSVNLENGNVRDLTPFQGVRAEIQGMTPKHKDRFLVNLNLRDRRLMDVHEVNLESGAVKLVAENPGDVIGWDATDDFEVLVAMAARPDGSTEIRVRDSASAPWRTFVTAPFGEQVTPVTLDEAGTSLVLESTLGSNTARVLVKNIKTGTETILAENPSVDAGRVMIHPIRHYVQAVDFPAGRQAWYVVDPTVRPDFEAISKLSEGDFGIVNRDHADKTWLVAFNEDRGPIRYYAWDREAKKGTFLFVHQPKLEGLPLAQMRAVSFPARDGLALNGYLTLPVGAKAQGLPLVLYVHGGPWARDTWGYNSAAQWLANRGYAVMQVNFRGSTGYGKKFLNAGNKQWGKAMHTDLLDAVDWSVAQGWVDPKKVAIMGGSYGGYSALAGVTFTPDVFKCSVDIVGPSNLFTLLSSIPPYWAPQIAEFHLRMGDPKTDEALLRAASPLFSADKIKVPLLIGQGANDPRVKQAESEQIVAAIEKNGGGVTYVLYPDEGHGFARPQNRVDFFARAEAFLGDCLGGRVEPLPEGGKVPGSTAVVKVVTPKAK